MSKSRTPKARINVAQKIPQRLKRLSKTMEKIGLDMEYYGGFGPMGIHGRELLGAARVINEWLEQIKASTPIPIQQKKA